MAEKHWHVVLPGQLINYEITFTDQMDATQWCLDGGHVYSPKECHLDCFGPIPMRTGADPDG